MPFLWTSLFTWALTASNGFGPLFSIKNNGELHRSDVINVMLTTLVAGGWTVAYAFCYTITGGISTNATFAINMAVSDLAFITWIHLADNVKRM